MCCGGPSYTRMRQLAQKHGLDLLDCRQMQVYDYGQADKGLPLPKGSPRFLLMDAGVPVRGFRTVDYAQYGIGQYVDSKVAQP